MSRLLEQYASDGTWDMRGLLIVLPSGLAGRRLNELLAITAQQQKVILYPPRIVTVGGLAEQLYVAKYPFASDLVQQLAWMHALRTNPTEELTQVLPVPPPKSASQQWLELAKLFSGVHRELASDRLDFAKVVAALGAHPEALRWRVLAKIQRRYLDKLDELQLWDIQTARLCALDFEEPTTDKRVVVVGCVDLNQTQCGFLEQIAQHVEVWIAAPTSAEPLFERFGNLNSAAWQEFELDIPANSLLVGNSPTDQAELACACLAELGDRYHAREVTLGVPDSSLIAELRHQLAQCSIPTHYGPGTPLAQSEPVLLLKLISNYVDTRSFAAFAALLRHSAVDSLLKNLKAELPPDWLSQVDDYYQAALPKLVDDFVNTEAKGAAVYQTLAKTINRWLAKLNPRPRPISSWVQPLLAVVQAAYDRQICDVSSAAQSQLYTAASQLRDAILSLRDIPTDLEPHMTISELVDWLIRSSSGQLVPEPSDATAVELLGWLELAFDDAPALVVTGMHDGVVPESVNADAFLPNSLRRQLGLMDNARRYARDMYALHLMLQSRETVRIVVGKTDAAGDPLVPSRLLLACNLAELPDRVLHLVKEDQVDVLPEVEKRWKKSGGPSQLSIPRPKKGPPPRHITVTAFRDFLQCPYRFYLRHVLKLRGEHDADVELDAAMFGNLLHDTLQLLGEGPIAKSCDAEEIEAFLLKNLQTVAIARFGPNPPAAVLIQIEQAEERLRAFAPRQAERMAEGWEIRFVERGVGVKDKVLVGRENPLTLIGRIDRIDYHPKTKRWAIWDYKTSESAKHPVSVHWSKSDGWKDLQLPLYLKVAKKLKVGDNPTLGYIALPKQEAEVGFHLADFSQEQLREADAMADEVATKVANREFWPEDDQLPSVRFDDFGRICQTDVQHVSVDPPRKQPHRHQPGPHVPRETVDRAAELLAAPPTPPVTFEPLLIRASAGTGKTFQLTNRLLRIILSGQEVDHILASTFTRKAAGEIMHRVLQRLALGVIDEKASREFAEHLSGVDTSSAACLAALRRVTRSLHRFRVGTLDSFFAQVARTFSLEMGLPNGWSAMDPVQEPQYQMQAIGQMLDNQQRKTLVDLVRMLAKGESKRQVAEQIRQTVASGYGVFRGTEAAAWDQLPLPAAPSEAAVESALLTLDAYEVKDRRFREQIEKLHLLASAGNWEAVVAHGIYTKLEDDPPTYYRQELDNSLIAALRLLAERAAAELLPIRRHQTLASHAVLSAYDNEYTSLVRRQRALAFSDVTFYLARWMLDGDLPSQQTLGAQQLEFRLDCGVQHLLLDEFQDTAPEQWMILRPLARPLGGPERRDRSFFCVGDTKQAIYGWRGGVAEIFDSVDEAVKGLQQREMSESFRSSPPVMQAVNDVFTRLTQHANFAGCDSVAKQWSDNFPEHRTSRTELPGYVRLQNGPQYDRKIPIEERMSLFLNFTAQQIVELTQQCPASIGVLFRTNADVGRMISLLRDMGVSASQDGGNPLTDSVAVELVLSLIHLADHPGDSLSAFHVRTSPLQLETPFKQSTSSAELAAWFRREVAQRGLGAAVEGIANLLADQLSWWDQHRLEQLMRAAYAFQPNFNGRLRDFEEAVIRARVALPSEAQVKVMTIHKSKGLEFDAVFLPELEIDLASSSSLLVLRGDDPCLPPNGVLRYMNSSLQAMLPDDWQRAFANNKQRVVNESLCLLYVAMTRARQALYMTARPTSRGSLQEFGSLLQSTLGHAQSTGKPEAVLYEEGTRTWYDGAGQPQEVQTPPARPAPPLKVALRTDAETAPVRGLRVTAPSRLEQTIVEPLQLATAFSFSHSVGATYGTLIHAFFEQVEWLEDYVFDREQLRRVALARIDPEALRHLSIESVLDDFEEMLQLASVRAVLGRNRYQLADGARVEIDTERAISLLMDQQLVTGTIDRLAVTIEDGRPVAAEIIDFKTDTFDSSLSLLWLDDRIAHHRPQLEIYAQVVSQLFDLPLDQIATYLVMLSTDDLVRCDHVGPSPPQGNLAAVDPATAGR